LEIIGEIRHPGIVEMMLDTADIQFGKMMVGWLLQGPAPCFDAGRISRSSRSRLVVTGSCNKPGSRRLKAPAHAQASAADLKSLTHSRQNRVQGLQIESGTRIIDLLVPMTFRSPRKGVSAMERGLRKVGTRPNTGAPSSSSLGQIEDGFRILAIRV